jgi:hypothetical protein
MLAQYLERARLSIPWVSPDNTDGDRSRGHRGRQGTNMIVYVIIAILLVALVGLAMAVRILEQYERAVTGLLIWGYSYDHNNVQPSQVLAGSPS